MIKSLKTEDGYIYALIEYEQIAEDRILIKYAWVHDDHQNNGAIPGMVTLMAQDETTNKTNFVGWERGEKDKPFRWYPVYRILRRL